MRFRLTFVVAVVANLHSSQSLAMAKLHLAQKEEEFEKLQLEYLKLEKFSCGLKLELASTKALLDK